MWELIAGHLHAFDRIGRYKTYDKGRVEEAAGGSGAGGRNDFLGYYAMLGLDVDAANPITTDDVKRAFREAALRWHPDRQKVGPSAFSFSGFSHKLLFIFFFY